MGIGPMRRPSDRKIDTSPYTGNMYLSLPNETCWRRTSSDSAIHQNFLRNYVSITLVPRPSTLFLGLAAAMKFNSFLSANFSYFFCPHVFRNLQNVEITSSKKNTHRQRKNISLLLRHLSVQGVGTETEQ